MIYLVSSLAVHNQYRDPLYSRSVSLKEQQHEDYKNSTADKCVAGILSSMDWLCRPVLEIGFSLLLRSPRNFCFVVGFHEILCRPLLSSVLSSHVSWHSLNSLWI